MNFKMRLCVLSYSSIILGVLLLVMTWQYWENHHKAKTCLSESSSFQDDPKKSIMASASFLQEYYCSRLATSDIFAENSILFKRNISLNLPSGPVSFDMFMYNSNDATQDAVSYWIRKQGSWEMSITEAIDSKMHSFAKNNGIGLDQVTFVDIGANIGWFSLVFANAGYNVISFEPMPENEIILRQNKCLFHAIHANPTRWTYLNLGLGENRETCKSISRAGNYLNGITKCGVNITIDPGFSLRGIIEVYPLDQIIDIDGDLKIGAVKMDVEGFEKFVILGGSKFFSSPKIEFIAMELLDSFRERSAYAYQKLIDFGFTISDKDGGVALSFEQAISLPNGDIIAYRK
jgi:FkbM family methyltransferase